METINEKMEEKMERMSLSSLSHSERENDKENEQYHLGDGGDGGDGGDDGDGGDGVAKNRQKKKNRYFEHHIRKILKEVSPDRDITQHAKTQLNDLVIITCKLINNKIRQILSSSKKKTITGDEIDSALKLLFIGQLAQKASDEGKRCLQQYNDNSKTMKGQSKHLKASILIPPSILERILRMSGSHFHVGYTAPIVLAGAIEYFIAQILELSMLVNVNNPKKNVRITINDLETGVRSDKEMSHFFTKHNIHFFEAGIVPFIHPEILSKSGRNDKKSIKMIEKLQENNRNVFPKRFFESKCKNYISLMFPDIRFQKGCFSYLQDYIEKWMLDILQYTNILTIYAKKSRVTSSDIELVSSIMEKKYPDFLDANSDSQRNNDYMVFVKDDEKV